MEYVVCQVCKKQMKKITNTHLAKHSLTEKQYKHLYPAMDTVTRQVKDQYSRRTKGLSYEEIYGKARAAEIKKRRSKSVCASYVNNPNLKHLKSQLARKHRPWLGVTKEDREKQFMNNSSIKDYTKAMFLVRKQLIQRAQNKCELCGLTGEESLEKTGKDLILHHLTYSSIVPSLEEVQLVCSSCHAKLHSIKGHFTSEEPLRRIIIQLLTALDVDLKDDNFKETPRRFANVLIDFFGLNTNVELELENFSNAVFECASTELVTVDGIRVFSMCPHHLLPVEYRIAVGYIPNGYAIGLSKLARLCKLLARYPKLQESVTQEIANNMQRHIGTEDVMVIVKGRHMCMCSRGVEQPDTWTITSAVRGRFITDRDGANPREEMLKLIKY